MAVSIVSSGTQLAVVGTEHTLATMVVPGIYVLVVDSSALINGDAVELRLYGKVVSGAETERQIYMLPVVNAQGDPLKESVPVVSTVYLRATLKQTAGSGRSMIWAVYQL